MKTKIATVTARLALMFTALLLLVLAVPQTALAVTNQSLAVPLYASPDQGSYWNDVTGAGSSTVPFIVANPHNGPGGAAEPAYVTSINRAAASGIRPLGYVQTNYQARPFKESFSDIDAWYRMYPNTKGMYIDLIKEGGPAEACYTAALYTHIKNIRPNDTVVLSPGSHISSTYEPYADIFVNAMMDYGTYQTWKVQYRGFEDKPLYQNRFWHMVTGVSSDQYNDAFAMVRNNNAGWTYITDKTTPTPFNATSAFWQNEVNDVANLPASSIPNRGKTTLPRGCISLSASAETVVDTTVSKQSNSKSSITVNNTSQTYDSEPVTQMQLLSAPAGAALASVSGDNWTCTKNDKPVCSYNLTIPASSSTKLATEFKAGCDFGGGEAMMRLTNYAGNRWDIAVPLRPPIGCDASTPAGKINTDATGQVINLTTQSEETTPEITPLGGHETTPKEKTETGGKGLSALKIALIIVLGVLLIGVITLVSIMLYQRQRYRTHL